MRWIRIRQSLKSGLYNTSCRNSRIDNYRITHIGRKGQKQGSKTGPDTVVNVMGKNKGDGIGVGEGKAKLRLDGMARLGGESSINN